MSSPSPDPALDHHDEATVELLDGEVVSTTVSEVPWRDTTSGTTVAGRTRSTAVVAAQAAAVVTTGFVAGAIATAVVSRKVTGLQRRREAKRLPPVVGSRRFLVDVHLLGDR